MSPARRRQCGTMQLYEELAETYPSFRDNQARILWTRTDGMASLWTLDSNGGYTSSNYGPFANWTPSGTPGGMSTAIVCCSAIRPSPEQRGHGRSGHWPRPLHFGHVVDLSGGAGGYVEGLPVRRVNSRSV